MSPLARRVAIAQLQFVIALAVMFVVSSDSPRYWQGWFYWAVFSLCTSATAAWFTRRDPALIERRMQSGCAPKPRRCKKPCWPWPAWAARRW